MKWQEDLVRDIRFNTSDDDDDGPFGYLRHIPKNVIEEFGECNHNALSAAIAECGGKFRYALEIGVCRNQDRSSTHTIIRHLKNTTDSIYLGVDLDDKSFLDNKELGVHTIRENSSNYDVIVNKLTSLGVEELDFILIDGWHSINQVLLDWEYTRLLRKGGVVAFHDVTSHPGPFFFVRNIDQRKWRVVQNLCPMDNGFGYAVRI